MWPRGFWVCQKNPFLTHFDILYSLQLNPQVLFYFSLFSWGGYFSKVMTLITDCNQERVIMAGVRQAILT